MGFFVWHSVCFFALLRLVLIWRNLIEIFYFRYTTREDFAADIRLIFSNCEIFNEDESPVGKAGHAMQLYFEDQWQDLNTPKQPKHSSTSEEPSS